MADVISEIRNLFQGIPAGEPTRATFAAWVKDRYSFISWVGFYGTHAGDRETLWIHSYQGKLACLNIPLPKGVCGVAAVSGKCLVVDDVHRFPGHIACDDASRSELVIPFVDGNGPVVLVREPTSEWIQEARKNYKHAASRWVLDFDSHLAGAFTEERVEELVNVVSFMGKRLCPEAFDA